MFGLLWTGSLLWELPAKRIPICYYQLFNSLNYRNFYILVILLSLAGWSWLLYHMLSPEQEIGVSLCIFKEVTGLPCPACGTTRSTVSLLKGSFYEALYTNPLGFIASALLVLVPLWLCFDLYHRKTSLFECYTTCESFLKRPLVFTSFCVLILLNWLWNLYKGL